VSCHVEGPFDDASKSLAPTQITLDKPPSSVWSGFLQGEVL
jgi:hypothetical protein